MFWYKTAEARMAVQQTVYSSEVDQVYLNTHSFCIVSFTFLFWTKSQSTEEQAVETAWVQQHHSVEQTTTLIAYMMLCGASVWCVMFICCLCLFGNYTCEDWYLIYYRPNLQVCSRWVSFRIFFVQSWTANIDKLAIQFQLYRAESQQLLP